MADCTETDPMADAWIDAERKKAELRDAIIKKRKEIQERPPKSEYSEGIHDGWFDALTWVLGRL